MESIIRYESNKIKKQLIKKFPIIPLQELYYQKQKGSVLSDDNDIGKGINLPLIGHVASKRIASVVVLKVIRTHFCFVFIRPP